MINDSFMGVLVTALGGFAVALLTWITARRTGRTTEMTVESEIEDKASDNWRELYQEMRNLLAGGEERIKKLETKVGDLMEKSERQDKVIRDLTKTSSKQAETILEQKRMETQFREDLSAVYTWIESGMKPPAPTRPSYLVGNQSTK